MPPLFPSVFIAEAILGRFKDGCRIQTGILMLWAFILVAMSILGMDLGSHLGNILSRLACYFHDCMIHFTIISDPIRTELLQFIYSNF